MHGVEKNTHAWYHLTEAWHKMGLVGTDMTPMDIYYHPDLEFNQEIIMIPNYIDYNGQRVATTGFSLVNSTNGDIYAPHVSKDYQIFQNEQFFQFSEELLKQYPDLKIEAAVMLFGGKEFFLSVDAGDEIIVDGDKSHRKFIIHTAHDGKTGINILPVYHRIECNNMLRMALNQITSRVSIPHKGNVIDNVRKAFKFLQYVPERDKWLMSVIEKAKQTKITTDEFAHLLVNSKINQATIALKAFNHFYNETGEVNWELLHPREVDGQRQKGHMKTVNWANKVLDIFIDEDNPKLASCPLYSIDRAVQSINTFNNHQVLKAGYTTDKNTLVTSVRTTHKENAYRKILGNSATTRHEDAVMNILYGKVVGKHNLGTFKFSLN